MAGENHGTQTCRDFETVFRTELDHIRERHGRGRRRKIPKRTSLLSPTTGLDLTGLTCSGGGIRSASFCLGVLQGLQSKNVIAHIDYLSTVSGGGYIGTTMTIGMSRSSATSSGDGTFPFGRLDDTRRETPEVRHIRDNSRYLLQNGLPSAASAIVIYLRGLIMNVMVLLPILLVLAALLVAINPDTKELTVYEIPGLNLTGLLGGSSIPFTLATLCIVAALLAIYTIAVSVVRIAPLARRQRLARNAAWIFFIAFLAVVLELHTVFLRLVFESLGDIRYADEASAPAGAQLFNTSSILRKPWRSSPRPSSRRFCRFSRVWPPRHWKAATVAGAISANGSPAGWRCSSRPRLCRSSSGSP
jgi:hypothetical protein